MSVGFLIVTHGQLGNALVEAAEFILASSLSSVHCVAVRQSGSEMPDRSMLAGDISRADTGDGVLILTDLAGASPTNTIEELLPDHNARVVCGVNLPMLIRAWNYRNESLDRLAELAKEGGLRGIAMNGE